MSESDIQAKPPQTGLVDLGDVDFYNDPSDPTPSFTIGDLNGFAGSFSEIVLNVTWAELQPTANGPLCLTPVTNAISAVEAYNTANGTDVGIKLRVWGGYTAPDWAKNIDGPPITITGEGTIDPNKDETETIGRFWTTDYNDAWISFQNTLAADYDNNPLILGISNTAGASATDEPFVPLHPDQVTELEAGGYTDAAEELTLRNAIADYSGWSTTPLDYTMNLFHEQDSGKVVDDANVTLAVLQEAENSSRTVQAGNHALNDPPDNADAFIYAQLAADAALDPATVPGSYQTASPVNLGAYANWPSAVAEGVTADAGDIELWDGPGETGFTGETPTFVAGLAATLANGVAPVTGAPDDGAQLGFIAPGAVTGLAGPIGLTGTNAVLLASSTVQNAYTITISSTDGNMLTVADVSVVPDNTTLPVLPAAIFGADGLLLVPVVGTQAVSSTSLTFSGSLAEVNTILASLTDTVSSGTDVLLITATDSNGDTATQSVGVVAATAPSPVSTGGPAQTPVEQIDSMTYQWTGDGATSQFSDAANWSPTGGPPGSADTAEFAGGATPTTVAGDGEAGTLIIDDTLVAAGGSDIAVGENGGGDVDIADQTGTDGTLVLAGVNSTLSIEGNLAVGGTADAAGGSGTVIASLSPDDDSETSLAIGGALEVWGQGSVRFTGSLSANTIDVRSGGLISGDGTLTAVGVGPIVNDGTIEAVADTTIGAQEMTLASPVAGSGTILIDAGATLIAQDAVGPSETIVFATPDITQLSDDPYSPTTLVLEAPAGFQGSITDLSWADSLVLDGFEATGTNYNAGTLSIDGTIDGNATTLSFDISGNLDNLTPMFVTNGSGTAATTTVTFVAPGLGGAPSVSAPATLQAAVDGIVLVPVLVPNITLATPLPASPGDNNTIIVTVTAGTGGLSVGSDNGNTTITQPNAQTLILAGTLGAVETSLQSLTYQGATTGTDTIDISASDYFGTSQIATIVVTNGAIGTVYDWNAAGGSSFGDAGSWQVGTATVTTVPGGDDIALFGTGTSTVAGDGAVGRIMVNGSLTLTGAVSAQGIDTIQNIVGTGLAVIVNGALTLTGGAALTAGGTTDVGLAENGVLTVAGGALSLTDATGDSLVLGVNAGIQGTVLDLEQIEAAGTLVVGMAGDGTLRLLGAAATASDGAADIGQTIGAEGVVVVDGGEWATNGMLTVGDGGSGSVLVGGAANGITGQVTAYDAAIGAQSGGLGTVSLQDGDLLVADDTAASSTLTIGAAGVGSLVLDGNSNVTVGVALASVEYPPVSGGTLPITAFVDNTGTLIVGDGAGGSGSIIIGGGSSVLVDGGGTIGGDSGAGSVVVGQTPTDTALFALLGTLTIGATGQVLLGDADATVRASAVTLDAGATLSGAGTVSGDGGGNSTVMLADITNSGVIAAEGGPLLVYGSVEGTGSLMTGDSATLTLQAAVSTGQTLSFGTDGRADLNDVGAFQGTVSGFAQGDILDLASTDATTATWGAERLSLVTNDGTINLDVEGDYTANAFVVQSDGLGGTLVELACFASGTRIATPAGERRVEDLAIGDLVTTMSGAQRPIVWVGRRRVDIDRHPSPEAVRPVRIAAHAFGPNEPLRDLFLSPDHAVLIEDVLIPIKYLIDGIGVAQLPAPSMTYHHIELQTHDIVLAEGLRTETFLDTSTRAVFANHQGPVQLHPIFGREAWDEADVFFTWDAIAYAPLCVVGAEVERARASLVANRLCPVAPFVTAARAL